MQVAQGGSSHEFLPMLLRAPRLSHPELGGYSMLGFGDIILPGELRADLDVVNSNPEPPCPIPSWAATACLPLVSSSHQVGHVLTWTVHPEPRTPILADGGTCVVHLSVSPGRSETPETLSCLIWTLTQSAVQFAVVVIS